MAKFLSELDAKLLDDDKIWVLDSPLIYESDIVGRIEVPKEFETDFASVPRIPLVYEAFGDRAHREAVLHDWCYRIDAGVSFEDANRVFLEAMAARGKPFYVRYPMYIGVCIGGFPSFHKLKIGDKL